MAYYIIYSNTIKIFNFSGEELDQMVRPVFGDYFQNLSFSSDEGFGSSNTSSNAGSPQSAQKRKIRVSQKWKSPERFKCIIIID